MLIADQEVAGSDEQAFLEVIVKGWLLFCHQHDGLLLVVACDQFNYVSCGGVVGCRVALISASS